MDHRSVDGRWRWLGLLAGIACAPGPSARWNDGGAPMRWDSAYWSREHTTIELRPSGEVIEDDRLLFRIDRQGRLSDARGAPVAVLLGDGNLVAEDDAALGWIGHGVAYGADRTRPSVQVMPDGAVFTRGARAGQWTYCEGEMLRACTFVTLVVAAREAAAQERGSGSADTSPAELIQLVELLRLFR